MDVRRQKAHEIADRARITLVDGCYRVPSQSGNGTYTVLLDATGALCDCPDFELRGGPGKPCKHIMAARLFRDREARGAVLRSDSVEPSPKAPRKTYKQDWPNYNAAQINERGHFLDLLADLCRTIAEPPYKPGPGRRPLPLSDAIFAAVFKTYSMVSARRFSGSLEEAHRLGHISCMPHFNSVLNVFESAATTPILIDLIERSALPLAAIETDFAFDSSGFGTSRFETWYDEKYGTTRRKAEWVKVHIATGVKTNIVTAVVIKDKDAADVSQFPALVKTTAEGFTVKEASADKAYAATENFQALADCGATGYIPFKKNATGAVGGLFEKAFHYFSLNREEFLERYHKRSNVESTFSAVKRKFGDSIRSKTDPAMKNEALAKFVCHNVCCLISAWYELGIEPVFATATSCTTKDEPAQILRFPGA